MSLFILQTVQKFGETAGDALTFKNTKTKKTKKKKKKFYYYMLLNLMNFNFAKITKCPLVFCQVIIVELCRIIYNQKKKKRKKE